MKWYIKSLYGGGALLIVSAIGDYFYRHLALQCGALIFAGCSLLALAEVMRREENHIDVISTPVSEKDFADIEEAQAKEEEKKEND